MKKEEFDNKKKLVYDFVTDKEYKPMSVKEMAMVLQVPAAEKKDLRRVVEALCEEGKIHISQRGKVRPLADNLLTGRFMATQKGFGFVRVEGEEEDYFIPAHQVMNALDGDTVRISVDDKQRGKRKEATVVSVLERASTILVGTYSKSKSFGFVVADNHKFTKDIYIPKAESKGAVTGHKVVVEITDYGSENHNPEGRILEIIGHINDPGVDILSVIKAYGLPEEYPDAVMDQVAGIDDEVPEEQKKGRVDYRSLQTVTIDGEDAKDLDDAITLTKEGDIYHLGVHIADVSNYVQGGSALDKEALKRGTSVYLADRVIPMLPERLSNGICSLNQGQDRLTLSCLMDIDENGTVVAHRIAETVIRVDRRMSYNQVRCILEDGDTETSREYKEFVPMFFLMKELSALLRSKRHNRGSIDFDFPESKIILNGAGRAIDVKPYEQNVATQIIEDFMLMANETVAKEYCQGEYPFVYRTHDNPDPERVESLLTLLRHQGIQVQKACEEITPKEIQEILEQIQGMPNEMMISRLMLRTMKQARYTTECSGHFGLAAKYYCHFTSPIRRYPDLQIHRIIRDNIRGRLQREGKTEHYREILEHVAEQSSVCERRAQEEKFSMELFRELLLMDFMWNFRIQWKASFILRHCQMIIMNSMRKTMNFVESLRRKFTIWGRKLRSEWLMQMH